MRAQRTGGNVGGVVADNEREWVLRACAGDQAAFANLVEAYQGPIYNLAYRMLGSGVEAEDAAQEAFLRAYSRLSSYDPERKFSSWILSIASHYCIDRLRRRRHGTVSMEEINHWRWLPDQRPRPEELATQHERSSEIHALLKELPPQYRLVIVLRYWQEYSYQEIAEITESTESAVKSRLHRARRMMAGMLEEQPQMDSVEEDAQRSNSQHAVSSCF